MTVAEVLEVIRNAYAVATATTVAGHRAPAEMTATPAVIMRPADPWLVPNRKIGACAEARWTVELVGGRYELAASLDQLAAGYVGAVAALHSAGVGQVGPLQRLDATEVAQVPMISATFPITVPLDLGGP